MKEEIKNKYEQSQVKTVWVASLSYSTGLENDLVYEMGAPRFALPNQGRKWEQ